MVIHFLNQYFEERVEATEGIFTSIGWSQRGMKLQGQFSWRADGQRKFRMQFSRKMHTVFFFPWVGQSVSSLRHPQAIPRLTSTMAPSVDLERENPSTQKILSVSEEPYTQTRLYGY